MTNYEKIAGTKERLAQFLVGTTFTEFCSSKCDAEEGCNHPIECLLEWLEQEETK